MLCVQESKRGVIALKRIMHCPIKVSLNSVSFLKNKTLHELSVRPKQGRHMGWTCPGKEGNLRFSWSQWNSMNSLEGIRDGLGAPTLTPLVQDSACF